jgi:FkbM family methyltransferase
MQFRLRQNNESTPNLINLDWGSVFEILVNKFIESHYQEGSLFVDGGANYGLHLSIIASQNRKYEILAIEANPYLAKYLHNKFPNQEIKIKNVALSKQKGNAKFFVNIKDIGYSSLQIRQDHNVAEYSEIDVEVDTLDNLIELEENHVSIIKYDLEGAEFDALQGSRRVIEKSRPFIVIEYYDKYLNEWGYTKKAFDNWIAEIDYVSLPIVDQPIPSDCWYRLLIPKESQISTEFCEFRKGLLLGLNPDRINNFTKIGTYAK